MKLKNKQIELARGWARGDIKLKDVSRATGKAPTASYTLLARALRDEFNRLEKKVEVMDEECAKAIDKNYEELATLHAEDIKKLKRVPKIIRLLYGIRLEAN